MKTKHVQYETRGTCSKLIDVTADENDVIKRIDGIRCGTKGTSCPDQLCRALEKLKQAPLE